MINPSGRPGKFYADDRFGETIIKLNKEKIRPSANAKSDEFLREVVAPNVLTLWKSKEVMAQATGATSHGSHHSVVDSFKDVSFIVKLLLIEDVFLEKPGRGSGDNGESLSLDLFTIGCSTLASGIPLHRYKRRARGNWHATAKTREDGDTLFEDDINDIVGRDAGVPPESDDDV